jgi:hypothetical protein
MRRGGEAGELNETHKIGKLGKHFSFSIFYLSFVIGRDQDNCFLQC